jgi:hypothetical protein
MRYLLFLMFLLIPLNSTAYQDIKAKELVLRAIQHWRGEFSYTESEMTVHRESYEKSLTLKAWTKGRTESLVRFVKPAKDAGNATLMKGEDVWTFNPRTNRTVRIPPSMKGQSWMGSDFSYQDLSKDDDIIDQYEHSESPSVNVDKRIRTIISIPHDSAPVVWGREELDIREDLIIVEHRYYDQDGKLVKKLVATEVGMLGGRLYPIKARMTNLETGEWTEINHLSADFTSEIPDSTFTNLNLESHAK